MTDEQLAQIKQAQERRMEKARSASLDYAEGVQCMLDCGELIAEIDRLRGVAEGAKEGTQDE